MIQGNLVALTIVITLAVATPQFMAAPDAWGEETFDHTHALFDSVLQKYVKNGLVNYKQLPNDRKILHRYLAGISKIEWDDYASWSRQQKLALWINAYNALTIEVILRYYPIGKPNPVIPYPENSIRHIEGVWDKKMWTVAGKKFNLDHIEHVILRKELKEPKIHFVLVCASIGCPLLENRAFSADTIDQRLEEAAKNYIVRDKKVNVDSEKKIVWFPMIFDWFGEDFIDGHSDTSLFEGRSQIEKGLLYFIYERVTGKEKEMMRKNEFSIQYIPYDWSLNDQSPSK